MLKGRFHPVFAWLFLIWFGLSNSVFAGGLVICNDGHGGSRIEWQCDRNTSGECVTTCGDDANEDDPVPPHPCQDTPIQGDHQITKAPPRSPSEVTVPISVVMAVLVLWGDVPQPTKVVWASSEPQRPPDALKYIRTVVLLV